MSEFWLWFWRPLAEFLGVIAGFFILFAALALVFIVNYIYADVAKKIKLWLAAMEDK